MGHGGVHGVPAYNGRWEGESSGRAPGGGGVIGSKPPKAEMVSK